MGPSHLRESGPPSPSLEGREYLAPPFKRGSPVSAGISSSLSRNHAVSLTGETPCAHCIIPPCPQRGPSQSRWLKSLRKLRYDV